MRALEDAAPPPSPERAGESGLGDGLGSSAATAGLIHHSDRGVQYASAAYRNLLKAQGVIAR